MFTLFVIPKGMQDVKCSQRFFVNFKKQKIYFRRMHTPSGKNVAKMTQQGLEREIQFRLHDTQL